MNQFLMCRSLFELINECKAINKYFIYPAGIMNYHDNIKKDEMFHFDILFLHTFVNLFSLLKTGQEHWVSLFTWLEYFEKYRKMDKQFYYYIDI